MDDFGARQGKYTAIQEGQGPSSRHTDCHGDSRCSFVSPVDFQETHTGERIPFGRGETMANVSAPDLMRHLRIRSQVKLVMEVELLRHGGDFFEAMSAVNS